MQQDLIRAHGGELVDLLVDDQRAEELKQASKDWISWDLTPRQICDLELLLGGGFSPLKGFMGRQDYESVCKAMRLADGTLWPIPITLDVSDEVAERLEAGSSLALRDAEGVMLAALHVEETWKPDLEAEAQQVFGTQDTKHPAVSHLENQSQGTYVAGRLEGIQAPGHYDFRELRLDPAPQNGRGGDLLRAAGRSVRPQTPGWWQLLRSPRHARQRLGVVVPRIRRED